MRNSKFKILIFLLISFLLLFALLKNLSGIRNFLGRLVPDYGTVVEKGGVSCVKFRDERRNYVWGKIEVKFDEKLTGIEAHRLLKTESLRLEDQDIENYATGSSYSVEVPRGSEEDFVKKLKGKEGIEKVNLVHCE